LACNYKCATCVNTAINCLTCSTTDRVLGTGACLCPNGKYDDGSNKTCLACDNTRCATCSSFTTCILPCNANCATCDTSGACISCPAGRYLLNGACPIC